MRRERARIDFTCAVLNVLDVFAADIINSYLQAPSSEYHHAACGFDFRLETLAKEN